MGNIDNKEKEFAEILKLVTRTARENKNVISKLGVKYTCFIMNGKCKMEFILISMQACKIYFIIY